ncbi:MAG: hypothetical protein LBE91_20745 [Tannerella sp.]|nr:hypothetical protein [Tannerella sp.]
MKMTVFINIRLLSGKTDIFFSIFSTLTYLKYRIIKRILKVIAIGVTARKVLSEAQRLTGLSLIKPIISAIIPMNNPIKNDMMLQALNIALSMSFLFF